MSDRSKVRGQTKSDPLALQVGGGHFTNNPVPEKDFVTETATGGIKTTGCNGLPESSEDTQTCQMNVSGESRLETTDRKMAARSRSTRLQTTAMGK